MTDEELMLAVSNGDQTAYQIIVKQHLKPISHYAYRLLGSRKDTEDIAQETFLKLWINASKWRADKAKLTTWLHRITHNLCVDYLRKHGRLQSLNGTDSIDNGEQQMDSNEELERGGKITRLNTAINRLPEKQRSALMLCHYQGFSNKEAATIMNISVKALESSVARAKRSLRKQVIETDEKPIRVWNEELETDDGNDDDN
ncbi:MAG: sigma-70 family RNA polymerase sigma factor [Proteobacteria bacterium]|nr:sigma-70 family RNA polymerase sigma factor [Pseudomonadota bacterium]